MMKNIPIIFSQDAVTLDHSTQTYHSLMPQKGQLSPGIDDASSPFLQSKDTNHRGITSTVSLDHLGNIFTQKTVILIKQTGPCMLNNDSNFLCPSTQVKQSRVMATTQVSCMTWKNKDLPLSGLNILRLATQPPCHTQLLQKLDPSPQSSTAPVWLNAKVHTPKDQQEKDRWWACQLIQVRKWLPCMFAWFGSFLVLIVVCLDLNQLFVTEDNFPGLYYHSR